MCWTTSYGILIKQHTASKDIPVKKAFIVRPSFNPVLGRFTNEITSLFYKDYGWTKGSLQKSYLGNMRRFYIDASKPQRYIWSIEEGFHSAKNMRIDSNRIYCRLVVSNGKQETTIECSITNAFFNIKILNCIIPKGSKYYLNEYGEYVSDQLIVLPNQ